MKAVHFGAALGALAAVGCYSAPAHASEWYVKASVGQTTNSELSAAGGSIDLSDRFAYGADVGTSIGYCPSLGVFVLRSKIVCPNG